LLVLIFSVLSPDFDGVVPGTGGHSDAAVGHGDSGDSVIVPRQVSVVISFEEIPHVNGGIVGSGEENASGFREGHARQTRVGGRRPEHVDLLVGAHIEQTRRFVFRA